jgi:hypothetical protein
MKSTEKAKRDNVASELLASTDLQSGITKETPARVKRGFKRPRPELEEIIRLVNLLPADPPPAPLNADRMNSLPEELRDYLEEVHSAELESDESDHSAHHAWQMMEWEYLEIRAARENLRQLIREANEVSDEETFYFHEPVDAGAYLEITTERTVRVRMSILARAIEGAEIDYLRYCEMCRKIFYAGRKNQQCCTPKCAKAQRQKRWRQRYKDGEPAYHK